MFMEKRIPKLGSEILEQASTWFIDFNENQVDRAGREEFNAWLRRSPECVRAFLQVAAFWEDAGSIEKWSKLDAEGLIARALAEQNVVHLESVPMKQTVPAWSNWEEMPTQPEERGSLRREILANGAGEVAALEPATVKAKRRYRQLWLAAAATLLVVGIGMAGWMVNHAPATYVTEIGEQRSITLEDGSVVELNARSRVRVRFTQKERSVDLLEGQALFIVAKNPARPFVVTTDQTRVRAVGTQFDVYRKRSGTIVTVVEGRVAVAPTPRVTRGSVQQRGVRSSRRGDGDVVPPAQREFLVTAGEQVAVTSMKVALPAPVDTAIATAWTEKKLVFESAPLREVVEEFNRYNRQQLVIRDPELFDFHVSGVFPSTDSSRMVEFLRQRFGVIKDDSGSEIEIYRREKVRSAADEEKSF
jgi:transmembrane sensor